MTGKALELTKPERDVALITLTRPQEMNTLSHEFLDEFGHALDQLGESPPRALIVTGSGRLLLCVVRTSSISAKTRRHRRKIFSSVTNIWTALPAFSIAWKSNPIRSSRQSTAMRSAAVVNWRCPVTSASWPMIHAWGFRR